MIAFNRCASKVAFISFVATVAMISVTITLQGICNKEHHHAILKVRKRILVDEDRFNCDIIVVVKRYSSNRSSLLTGYRSLAKMYDCMRDVKYGSILLKQTNDYVCMFYAMLRNPSCTGYLFIEEKRELKNLGDVMKNDRNRIWFKRTYSHQREVHFCNEFLFNLNNIAICKKAYEELALLNSAFNNYEKRLNGSWHRPWNVEIALNALLWNGKGKLVCFCEEIEMFYVPSKYRETFLGLGSVFSKVKMSDIIAVPTILKSLDLESTFLEIPN